LLTLTLSGTSSVFHLGIQYSHPHSTVAISTGPTCLMLLILPLAYPRGPV
jgi:hypothetical protein